MSGFFLSASPLRGLINTNNSIPKSPTNKMSGMKINKMKKMNKVLKLR